MSFYSLSIGISDSLSFFIFFLSINPSIIKLFIYLSILYIFYVRLYLFNQLTLIATILFPLEIPISIFTHLSIIFLYILCINISYSYLCVHLPDTWQFGTVDRNFDPTFPYLQIKHCILIKRIIYRYFSCGEYLQNTF